MMLETPSISLVMGGRLRGEAVPALVLKIGTNYAFGLWIKAHGELPAQELDRNTSVLRWFKGGS